MLESKWFGTVTERAPLPIASPQPCLELFLSNKRLNDRLKGNVSGSISQFGTTAIAKTDTEH
jgi:hypothetical protein